MDLSNDLYELHFETSGRAKVRRLDIFVDELARSSAPEVRSVEAIDIYCFSSVNLFFS